ncbi:MAG: glycoside hydrolase family 43 protein [Bacteroidales bacterium]
MKLVTQFFLACLALSPVSGVNAQNGISKVWVSDTGKGTYRNPIIDADYSDPDVCRVGDDFYMTSSSFNCIPGLPILHSKDLVNWTLISHALTELTPVEKFNKPSHGDGVWAPSIRHHNGEFYIYWGDPDFGIYMVKTKNPAGVWEKPVLVKQGKGLIDSCPLWDEDGNAYLVHAYAGSRAGFKSVLAVAPMSADGTKVLAESRLIFDGHIGNETVEGPKFYKRNGYYYIFAPAGGVATGWQLVLRSKSPYGPFEQKIVMAQGSTDINGPHQGAWVNTQNGEDWFIHFQDKFAYGRVVHLNPMIWKNDWPVIGEDKDGDGCGEPVTSYRKPNVGATYPIATPSESDEFDTTTLGLQWQWHANSNPLWYFCDAQNSQLRLFTVPSVGNKSLFDSPNLLLQKTPTDEFTMTTKLNFTPNPKIKERGERAGVVVMGLDYTTLFIEDHKSEGLRLVVASCKKADKGGQEVIEATTPMKQQDVYLRVVVKKGGATTLSYSWDNKKFQTIGNVHTLKEGKWIGAKVGLYANRPVANNDGGWLNVDWFRVTK